MKKIIALMLCAVMLLSLCACGKSKEAQNVDDLILAIGEVSIDSAEKIAVAEEAYNALSDKDVWNIIHFAILQKMHLRHWKKILNHLEQIMKVIFRKK